MMNLSIVISYYKNLLNLRIILSALNNQSEQGFEVLLSEDDHNQETITFLEQEKSNYPFPIIHLYQNEDQGFRKNMMLNRSIGAANSENIAFIDGDCVPHKHFVKAYIGNIENNAILFGRRVMLDHKTSSKILTKGRFTKLNFFSLLLSNTKSVKEAIYAPYFKLAFKERGLVGCNWGVKKQHLLDVNGFDEDYVMAGVGEDNDIEWRLKGAGFVMKSVKNKAIVYHLYHKRGYSEDGVRHNFGLLREKINKNLTYCENGINKI